MICRFREGLFLRLCKLLKIRCCFWRKIQGTYFKISALYFKIYGLYFLRDALCFFGGAKRGCFYRIDDAVFAFLKFFSRTILLPCNISWRWRAMCS